jgi:hypothetical protein
MVRQKLVEFSQVKYSSQVRGQMVPTKPPSGSFPHSCTASLNDHEDRNVLEPGNRLREGRGRLLTVETPGGIVEG